MLNKIIEKFNKESAFLKFESAVQNNKNVGVFGLNAGEKVAFVSGLNQPILFVANNFESANKLQKNFEALGRKTFLITENLCEQILNEKSESEQINKYCALLTKLLTNQIDVVVCTANVLCQKLLTKNLFEQKIIRLKKGQKFEQAQLAKMCANYGYKRTNKIENKGDFAFRGDVFEIYPSYLDDPIRIDFFDDEIETIKIFDIQSYQSKKHISEFYFGINSFFCQVNVYKGLEKFINSSEKQNLQVGARNRQTEIADKLKQIVLLNPCSATLTYLLPFLSEFDNCIIDYLPENSIVCFEDVKTSFESVQSIVLKQKNIKEMILAGELLQEHSQIFFDVKKTFNISNTKIGFQSLYNANKIFNPEEVFSFNSIAIASYINNFAMLFEQVQSLLVENTVILLCQNQTQLQEFSKEFNNKQVFSKIIKSFDEVEKGLNLIVSTFTESFVLSDEHLAILSCFQKDNAQKLKAKTVKDVFLLPKVGDFVVHDIYGIGKCKAIERMRFSSYEKDYIILEYASGDKLFLPIEQASLISAYAGGSETPKLNRLGTDEFLKLKNKVKTSVKEMAINLLELYHKRENEKGVKYEKDDLLQQQFENEFPYNETIDQLSAINDIKQDMENGKVMDRLLCGDVGYGKTEVAMRAAFKTVQAGFQVAILVPTTILSFQHFNTFSERMKKFGINVQVLNRFKNLAQSKEIISNIANGKVDVIIGTHKLLNKNIKFKNLGLLVLDEEQRFGVEHKEKIKVMREKINVLSMSATPIPRTLHMSMVGIRDISLITTPPKGRLPIHTIVTEFSFALLKNAIQNELARDGQVLIIYNRIETILSFAQRVRELFPNTAIGVAHGRMDEKVLEGTILKVFNNETKILISTTLIENGVDLPNANTMIIVNADRLGLSQLYQLRGRIGRSNKDSYAYLTYEQNKEITEDANKRLIAMGEFSELGSGFKIAMKDLEIRGAGNVLGKQQHGHIEKVGYDMYCKLLDLSVKELKGEIIPKSYEVKLEIELDCFIPNEFIESTDERFKLFNTFCEVENENELEKQLIILKEIYSFVPVEVENLAKTIYLRNLCLKNNVKRVVLNKKKCLIEFVESSNVLDSHITNALSKYKQVAVLNLSQLPIIEFNLKGIDNAYKLNFIIDFLSFALKN